MVHDPHLASLDASRFHWPTFVLKNWVYKSLYIIENADGSGGGWLFFLMWNMGGDDPHLLCNKINTYCSIF